MRGALLVVLALAASVADAQPSIKDLPEPCRPYAVIPADVRDDTFGWNQLLSLAACLQDSAITPVTREDDLERMLDRYEDALVVPTLIYTGALESGPPTVQLHAAYQIGMAQLMVVVRARRSVTSPELRARLEPLLVAPLRLAWRTFAVIDRVADEDPSIVADEVARNEVRAARALLRVLRAPGDHRDEPVTRRRSRHAVRRM